MRRASSSAAAEEVWLEGRRARRGSVSRAMMNERAGKLLRDQGSVQSALLHVVVG